MTHLVETLSGMFAGWQSTFSNSKAIATSLIATHVIALLFGGGLAVSADRGVLRRNLSDGDARFRFLSDVRTIHTSVIVAIAVLLVTGLALAAADVETYFVSPIFWSKMVLFGVLVANGGVIKSQSEALVKEGPVGTPRTPRRVRNLKRAAVASLTLWSVTLVLGTALATYA